MRFFRLIISAAALAAAGPALAQDEPDPNAIAVAARQAHMNLYSFNLGALGAMAQGNMPYDAEVARAAAANLNGVAQLDQTRYWLDGTETGAMEGTRALPAIWEDPESFRSALEDLRAATAEMAQAAGEGLEPLQTALRGVGAACGACHESFRQPQ